MLSDPNVCEAKTPQEPCHPAASLVPSGSTTALLQAQVLPVCKLGLPPHPVVWAKWGFGSWKVDCILQGGAGRQAEGGKEVGKEEGKHFGFYKVKEIYFLRS